jgi:hypothetical protein
MSTLDVTCGRCEKKFRVRAEFAGRSTRCPGCSAPITIAGAPATSSPSSRRTEEEQPRARLKKTDDDDEPRRPILNWSAVESAFRREQLAVIFALLSILGGFFVSCAANMSRRGGDLEGIMIFVMLLFGIGPSLGTAAFGVMARVSALGAPRECLARGSAVASLLCSLAALISLVVLAFALMMSMDANRHDPLPMTISLGGLVLAGVASLATFFGFISQIAIYRRSAAVSRAIGRTATAAAVCLLVLLAIGVLYTIANELTGPSYYRDPFGPGYYQRDHSGFFVILIGVLMPIAFGVVLILYHRLLGAGRRSLSAEPGGRYEE